MSFILTVDDQEMFLFLNMRVPEQYIGILYKGCSSLKNKNALAGAALSMLILSNYGNVHSGRLLIFQAAPQAAEACVSISGPLLCQP